MSATTSAEPDAYQAFLAGKAIIDPPTGLSEIPPLPDALFPFQRDIVTWALRRGRAAILAGTGLGKSLQELSWGQAVHAATGGDVILFAPLAVAHQMLREAVKFGIPAKFCRSQAEVESGITITNYQKLQHFNLSRFIAIILDESSILKSTEGVYRTALIEQSRNIPFRLAATATPAPNDFMELGNHAEFLGAMSYTDMLSTFFTHDGGETQKWRLKGHAAEDFWRWMASWAVMLRRPSDLGYEDGAYALPPLRKHHHIVGAAYAPTNGFLFPMAAETLQERVGARRETVGARVEAAAALIRGTDRPWVAWCNLNAESEALTRAVPGAVEVRGSDRDDAKERKLDAFSRGEFPVLVSKPTICGHGMNWQHCADTVFVGLNDSFEQVFQAIRRFWRFGQTRPVNAHFIASEIEGAVVANLARKEAQAEEMAAAMVRHMADLSSAAIRGSVRTKDSYQPARRMLLPQWIGSSAA